MKFHNRDARKNTICDQWGCPSAQVLKFPASSHIVARNQILRISIIKTYMQGPSNVMFWPGFHTVWVKESILVYWKWLTIAPPLSHCWAHLECLPKEKVTWCTCSCPLVNETWTEHYWPVLLCVQCALNAVIFSPGFHAFLMIKHIYDMYIIIVRPVIGKTVHVDMSLTSCWWLSHWQRCAFECIWNLVSTSPTILDYHDIWWQA